MMSSETHEIATSNGTGTAATFDGNDTIRTLAGILTGNDIRSSRASSSPLSLVFGANNSPGTPSGFEPSGRDIGFLSVPTNEIPTTKDELGELKSQVYDLSVTAALDLSIPVAGSVSGG
jgi:hypothetical protein